MYVCGMCRCVCVCAIASIYINIYVCGVCVCAGAGISDKGSSEDVCNPCDCGGFSHGSGHPLGH